MNFNPNLRRGESRGSNLNDYSAETADDYYYFTNLNLDTRRLGELWLEPK